jgi:hypothetical protein
MKIYRVTWEEICSVEVEAETEDDAKDRVLLPDLRRGMEDQISKEPMETTFEVEEV